MLPVGSFAGDEQMVVQAVAYSHIGKVRKNNEDAILCDERNGLFAVADGIGGQENGEIASAAAVYAVEKLGQSNSEEPLDAMREAFYGANDLIYGVGAGKKISKMTMGTTLTAAWVRDNMLYLTHIGDSRAYLINSKGIMQISEDHSFVGELLRQGQITAEQAKIDPRKNMLLKALGQEPRIEVFQTKMELKEGDFILLCTDGLYNLVPEDELFAVVYMLVSCDAAIKELINRAVARGGYDNISACLISIK